MDEKSINYNTPNFQEKDILNTINSQLPRHMKISEDKSQNLMNFTEHVFEVLSNPKKVKQSIKDARELLNFAKEDLRDSKILYDSGSYRNSMVFLEQSAEKLFKAQMKFVFGSSDSDLIKWKHKALLGVKDILNTQWASSYLDLISTEDSKLAADVTKLDEIHSKLADEIAVMRYEDIHLILSTVKQVQETIKKSIQESSAQIDAALVIGESFLGNQATNAFSNIKVLMPKMIESFTYSCIAAVLTFPHYTKYHNDKLKRNIYTIDLGIIKAFEEICSIVKSSIDLLEQSLEKTSN